MARILIIDDDPTNIDLLARLVTAFGHEDLHALSGEEALAILATTQPDLVLCDVHMPGIDGFEVLRRCRLERRLDGVKIIAVTALAMVGDRERVLKAGFDGYISKPIEPETFIADLARALPASPMSPPAVVPPLPPATVSEVNVGGGPRRREGYVLVIDDSKADRMLMQQLLESCGFEVVATDGADAGLEAAAARLPSLVICDVHMPEASGYSVIEDLRKIENAREIPFIFLSSSARPRDIVRGLSLGAVRFLVRPIEPELLLRELEPFFEGSP